MAHKNAWVFNILNAKTHEHLNTLCFYGVDSEEGHTNCINWASKHYGFECTANLLEGEIEKNEERRTQLATLEKSSEEKIINIMRVRKFKTITRVKDIT